MLSAGGVPENARDSFLLEEDGKLYTRSTAALRVCLRLGGAWPLLYGLIIIPAPLRNMVYDLIARNRYKWFGKSAECWLPSPEWKDLFIA